MNIYVKFCGGCNPRYDRALLYKRLREDFKDAGIHTDIGRAQDAEFVILIQGCQRACAAAPDFPKAIEVYEVNSANAYDNLADAIRRRTGGQS